MHRQIRVLGDVLTDDHAAHWRVHHCFCIEQDCYRPRADHKGPESCGYTSKHSSPRVHGSSLLCKYVDQVEYSIAYRLDTF